MDKKETKSNQEKEQAEYIYTKDIARAVQERTGYSLVEIEKIIEVLEEVIIYEIFQLGRHVTLKKFGTFWCRPVRALNNKIFQYNGQKPKKSNKKRWVITFKTNKKIRPYLGEIMKQK